MLSILAASLFLTMCSMGTPGTVGEARAEGGGYVYPPRYTLLPVVAYAPETGLMLGGAAVVQHKPLTPLPQTRPSSASISAVGSANGQVMVELLHTTLLPEDRWLLPGKYQVYLFPEEFWGIGSQKPPRGEYTLDYQLYHLEQAFLRQVLPSVFAGPQVRGVFYRNVRLEDGAGNAINPEWFRGLDRSSSLGLGLSVRKDRRDSIPTPTRNHYLELGFFHYASWLGTTSPFTAWLVDARQYFDLFDNKRSVLGFHFRGQFTGGAPPVMELAHLGGREILRGYHDGRFRDMHAARVQAEWRQHLHLQYGVAFFAGLGDVWPSLEDVNFDDLKWVLGGGLRYNLNPDEPLNIRLDYGVGRDMSAVYLTFGEAF